MKFKSLWTYSILGYIIPIVLVISFILACLPFLIPMQLFFDICRLIIIDVVVSVISLIILPIECSLKISKPDNIPEEKNLF